MSRDDTIRRHILHVADIEDREAERCAHGFVIPFTAVRPQDCDDCQDEHAAVVAAEGVGK